MERESKKWLNVKGAAAHISMSVGFVRKSVRNGTIPHCRIGSKALRFDRDALDVWLAAQGRGGEFAFRKN